MVTLTAIAAFFAAGLSLVNVIVSYRLAGRGQLSQWRRDAERPIVANVLTLSRALTSLLSTVATQRGEWLSSIQQSRDNENTASRDAADSQWQKGRDMFENLRLEVTGLDLIAGQSPRETAAMLVSALESLVHWLRPASGTSEQPYEIFTKQSNVIIQAERDLILAVRQDIGVDG